MEKSLKAAEQVNGIFGRSICQQVQDGTVKGETPAGESLVTNRGLEIISAPSHPSSFGETWEITGIPRLPQGTQLPALSSLPDLAALLVL